MASPITGTVTRPASGAVLRWTVHPAAQEPARAALVALVVLIAAALAWSVTRSVVVTAAGTALLLGSLAAYFLPRTYVLDASGAAESGPLRPARRLEWAAVRCVTRERHGVHLSPLYRPSRWTVDRGLFLRVAGNAEDVTRFALERRAGQDAP